MTQIALPIADVSNSGWTPLEVWDQVNGSGSVTATLPPGGSFVVDLDHTLLKPGGLPQDGGEVLMAQLLNDGPDDVLVTLSLLQGNPNTPQKLGMASTTETLKPGSATVTLALSSEEVQSIFDYQ